jgi:outer membrane protein OmpA-like peptidoglycan-associated protein
MRGKKVVFIFLLAFAKCFAPLKAQGVRGGADSSSFLVKRLNINSNRGDFSPYLMDKKLYFSTGRVHRYGVVYYNEDTLKELEDVFYAEQIDSVDFKHPHYFSEKINTRFNDGPLCFNKTGDVLYITGNDIQRITKHVEPLDIFVSHKVHGHWETPVSLPFCQGTFSYCHPALMKDGKTLIFASNMPGGYGGMDLYTSVLENGNWSNPKNMGSKINSSGNEIFPFVSANDVLYFSSNRGGNLDIFSFDLRNAFDSDLQKEGWPLNTDYDDFGVWIDSTGSKGYFSSNRLGNDDIFYYENLFPRFENCVTQTKPKYCYTFFEESTLQSEDTLGMVYEWDFGDGNKKRGIEVKHCYARPGNYSVQLNVVDKASGALFMNELSYDFAVEDAKLLYIVAHDTLAFEKDAVFESERSVIPGYTIGDRFWFFGDEKFAKGVNVKHKYERPGTYVIQLGVLARNDSTKHVDKFCTQKTVLVKDSTWIKNHRAVITKVVWPPSDHTEPRFKAKEGEGVDFRVHLGSSSKDIPVDSKIFADLGDVKKTKEKNKYHYTSGKVKKMTEAIPYYRKARAQGFTNAVVVSFYKDSLMSHQEKSYSGEIPARLVKISIDTSSVLWTVNVFFDFNKAEVSKQYQRSLDSVCGRLKKDKKLELIILAISDTVGSNQYNLKLSNRRASAVQGYLRKQGIRQERLDVISLGESLPIEYNSAKNVLLSNRRVELIIVKNAK